jgi:hypothetical protein
MYERELFKEKGDTASQSRTKTSEPGINLLENKLAKTSPRSVLEHY